MQVALPCEENKGSTVCFKLFWVSKEVNQNCPG